MNIKQLRYILFILLIGLPLTCVSGQSGKSAPIQLSGDSLTLTQVLQSVLQNHPSVKQAEEALNVADAKIGLAKANYYPDIDVSASYSHLAPDFPLEFGGMDLLLYARDNYSASLNINQTIYDFGKTSNGIKVENENKTIVDKSIYLVKQQLTIRTINTYYLLVYYQQAVDIKDEELNTLHEHLVYVEKKQVTGSATQYELLSTKVRISNTENQKQDLITRTFRKLQELKKKYKIEIDEEVLNKIVVQDSNNPRAVDFYFVRKGGIFPHPVYPSIDFVWHDWE